jgi:hypothetical protein
VNAFLNAGTGGEAATADASNTLRFFLTPVGDFTYSTASGNSYLQQTSEVPEPSTLFLVGIGAAGMARRVRDYSKEIRRKV